MTSLALAVLILAVPTTDADLTHVFADKPANGGALLYPNDSGSYLFSFWQLPIFIRYDVDTGRIPYDGERLTVATLKGPLARTVTVSQLGIRGERLQLHSSDPAKARPIIPISKNKLLVQAVSSGFYPLHRITKAPSRVFAISIVRLDARGSNPNSDYLLPRDDYGWYEAIEAHADERTGVMDVLVAHTMSSNSRTRFEAYRIAGDKLTRVPDRTGRYAKLTGKSLRIFASTEWAHGGWPFSPTKVAADRLTGSIAFIRDGKVTVGSRVVPLPHVETVRYIGGRLYASTRSNPDMQTRRKTFVWNPSTRKFDLVGEFGIAGVSPNGKVWIKQFSDKPKVTLTNVP